MTFPDSETPDRLRSPGLARLVAEPGSTTRVSIVVPVRDDAEGVVRLLRSIPRAEYERLEVIVNDDPRSRDSVEPLIRAPKFEGLEVKLLCSNLSRAQGRIEGARQAQGDVLVHLDADMEVTPALLAEIVSQIDSGADALVLPEVSVGSGFWARCKVLEKACWQGDPEVEAARAIRATKYWQVGGHDPDLVWGEDKDLDLRIREVGGRVGVTKATLHHDERSIGFWESLSKKSHYASTAGLFAAKHPEAFRDQRSLLRLPVMIRRAWSHEHDIRLVTGLLVLKVGEYAAVGIALARRRVKPPGD